MDHPPGSSINLRVALFVAARLVMNACYRMIYPFIRVFASGMGITLQTASLPLSARSLIGILGPLFAPVADRYGRKVSMMLGLSVFNLGMAVLVIWPSFPAFFAALMLANLGNMIFIPAMQAYLGDRVPYHRRGRVLALTEVSWSLSFILLVPLAGLLIGWRSWTTPFSLFLAFGLLALALIAWRVPYDPPALHQKTVPLWGSFRHVFFSPAARTALVFSLSITLANEVVNLVFGAWMSDTFQWEIAALGLAATVIGLAELSGEGATALLVDRVGKKRAVGAGVLLTSLAAVLLPWLGRTSWGALVGLFLFYLGFEFTLVSFIPVLTEVLPHARATLMATNLAASSLGRALGALAGTWLYTYGFGANALVALLLNGVALLALSRVTVAENRPKTID